MLEVLIVERIIFLADMHGSAPDLSAEDFDAIIAGGDFCQTSWLRDLIFSSPDDEWWKHADREWLKKKSKQSIESGKKVVKHMLSYGAPVFTIPGNTDFYGKHHLRFMSDKYEKITKGAFDMNMSLLEFEGINLIGYGGTAGPEIVDGSDDEVEHFQELYSYFHALFSEADMRSTIVATHVPPAGYGFDVIRNPRSPMNGMAWGSQLMRRLKLDFRPKLMAFGHFHENPGKRRCGRTMLLNPGPAFEGNYAVISTGKRWSVRIKKSGLAVI